MTRSSLTILSYPLSLFLKPAFCTFIFAALLAGRAVAGDNFLGPGLDIVEAKDSKMELIEHLSRTAEKVVKETATSITYNAGYIDVAVEIKNCDSSGTTTEAKVSVRYTRNLPESISNGQPEKNTKKQRHAESSRKNRIEQQKFYGKGPGNELPNTPKTDIQHVDPEDQCSHVHNEPPDWKFIVGMILIPLLAACINKKWGASK